MTEITPRLGYWNMRGLGQFVKLLLNYVGQEFEDVKYTQKGPPTFSEDEWQSVKYTLGIPFPNLPYYIDGDTTLTQSNAILRYIGRKHNLVGETEDEVARCDVILDQTSDFQWGLIRHLFPENFSEKWKEAYLKSLPSKLQEFETFIGDHPWFAGEHLSVCDFRLYEGLDQHRLFSPGCLDNYPKIIAFLDRFEKLPPIKSYMESDKFMKIPVFSPRCVFH